MKVTRRGGRWEIATILGWLEAGAFLRVLEHPRRGPLAYVTDGRVPRIILAEEACHLIGTGAVRPTSGRGTWDDYTIADMPLRKAGGGRGADTPRAAGETPA